MRTRRGFTLIEILVVIFIIGITATMALLSFGDFGASRNARLTAENFSAYIKMLQQRALFEAGTLKVTFTNDGYETQRLVENNWQAIPNRLFRWRSFPKYIRVRLYNLPNKSIILSSSGEISSFRLSFGTSSHPDMYILMNQNDNKLIIKEK